MEKKQEEKHQIYIIPQNFIDTGTFFGGMFKLRNTLEAGAIALCIGLPVLSLALPLTTKIIILCLTALPLALFALIGISGDSLSEFIINFFRFLKNRRTLYRSDVEISTEEQSKKPSKAKKERKAKPHKAKQEAEDFDEEFSYSGDVKTSKVRKEKPKRYKEVKKVSKEKKDAPRKSSSKASVLDEYIPISKISNGIIHTNDNRFIKILEIEPINFLLRSAKEQKNIIWSFVSYLKISPVKMQFKVLTKSADINKHLMTVRKEMECESDEKCKMLQKDYINLIQRIGSKEAVTRRFFLIFEYETFVNSRKVDMEDVTAQLETVARTAKTYFMQCGNEVVEHDNEDEFLAELFYSIFNRRTSAIKPLRNRIDELVGKYTLEGNTEKADNIPIGEFVAPESIDFNHGRYILMDGVYHSYLLLPSHGFKPQVMAGWLSLIVNAGDGIDMDFFLTKQAKERIQQKLGQQIRINRSKIKDTSDTNSDFDDLDSAIRSGYFLKDGLGNNEDFYYMNILITITADSERELEWRIGEMRKLLISQDLDISTCNFIHERGFLSALPLLNLDKNLYGKSKRNVLTTGAASCYPFTSFEMCDDNGILLGVNKHNNSLVITDIFNSRIYKNANMAILGTSGAGKTFTMQLMALRMRRKNIQTFIIAPLKGHEFYRACKNIGGEFIQISPASENCINVLEIRKSDHTANELIDGPVMNKSELASKIQRLHIFFSLLIPDMNHEERQLLDDALIKTYAVKGITHDNETLISEDGISYKEMPILGDLHTILKENRSTIRLANILNRLVNGSAKTFNQQTNVSLENKYIVLDISELTGDLLTVGMFVGLDFVWDKAKEDRTKEKAIFVDEVWQLIGASSNRLAAEYVLEIFKIIRGYGGAAIAATQDLNDFFALEDGKYGKGIINNAKTKIILNLEEEEADRVQSILKLSEAEMMNITHFGRGNGLISTNNNNITVEFKASQLEKELITTDRHELQAIMQKVQDKENNTH